MLLSGLVISGHTIKMIKLKFLNMLFQKNFRGGGLLWIHKILLLYIPIIYLIFSILVVFLMSLFFYNQNFNNLLNFSLIFLLAIFPIFIHEFTKGLKVAKAYFSVLPTLLIFIAYGLDIILKYNDSIYLILICIIFLQLIFTIYTLFNDTIPCRTSANKVANYLIKNKIKKFTPMTTLITMHL